MKRACVIRVVGVALLLCLMTGCGKEKGETEPKPTKEAVVTPDGEGDITAAQNAKEKQASMLQELVSRLELPQLEKRLPVEADRLTEELSQIGVYGGSVQLAQENADTVTRELVAEGLFCYGTDGEIAPNIAKGYMVNVDKTKYTIYLREGMRWSDGVLFTADDCIFFYEHLCLPEVFGESLWSCFTAYDTDGMPKNASFKKLDEYSFEVTFSVAKPEFLEELLAYGGICFAPEHYFVNLLPEYMGEDAAVAKAKDMGYGGVKEMLQATIGCAWNTPGVPTLNPYCISTEEGEWDVTGEYYRFVRNPYYWKVDAEGKQLPYLDALEFTRVSTATQKLLLITEGYLSVGELEPGQLTEAWAGTERGNYRIVTWTNFISFAVNTSLKNFPEAYSQEQKVRGIGAAHVEGWFFAS